MAEEEENSHYNVELVSVIYNNELREHLNELQDLNNTLTEDGQAYRDSGRCRVILGVMSNEKSFFPNRSLSSEDKLGQVKEMQEYIEQALANLAYSITHATQKVGHTFLKHIAR